MWTIVLILDGCQRREWGRYNYRGEAETVLAKMKRMLGSKFRLEIVFDQELGQAVKPCS